MPSGSKWARTACDALVAVLLAPACAACRAPLESPTSGAVCPACWRSIPPLRPPLCEACGDALQSWRVLDAGGTCARCRRRPSAVSRTAAVGLYDGSLREILHALKYRRRRSIAGPLSRMMRQAGAALLHDADVIVPVPLHYVRRLTRGFNQASDLASGIGVPVAHALSRTRNTGSQADLPAARRHANVRGAFRLSPRASIAGCTVVLVDDVSTTGATLDACARTLIDGGARDVRALIAARAAWRSPGGPRP